jgi:hypothetical protein
MGTSNYSDEFKRDAGLKRHEKIGQTGYQTGYRTNPGQVTAQKGRTDACTRTVLVTRNTSAP